MGWILTSCTVLGGLAALVFFLDRFLARRRGSKTKGPTTDADLSPEERAILCAAAAVGDLWLVKTSQHGTWVRAGSKDFFDEGDPAHAQGGARPG